MRTISVIILFSPCFFCLESAHLDFYFVESILNLIF